MHTIFAFILGMFFVGLIDSCTVEQDYKNNKEIVGHGCGIFTENGDFKWNQNGIPSKHILKN